MRRKVWVYDPHSGGARIPATVRERTQERILKYAKAHYAGKFTRLAIRFRGALCYIDAYTEPAPPLRGLLRALGETRQQYLRRVRNVPLHLCRLRYFGDEEAWSMAFYTYSNERYEPCTFRNGTFHGTPEGAFEVGAAHFMRGEAFVRESLPEENGWIAGPVGGTMRPRTTRSSGPGLAMLAPSAERER